MKRVIIKGDVPWLFFSVIRPYPYLITEGELFSITLLQWWKDSIRYPTDWIMGLYDVAPKWPLVARILPGRHIENYDEMVSTIINAVTRHEKEISEIFESDFGPFLSFKIEDLSILKREYTLTLERDFRR